ncbi:metallophosphoesterase domain-containing protein [Marinobacter salarius]|nr:metallophosphoesterase domain-containing protein [Marinobacter salarius]
MGQSRLSLGVAVRIVCISDTHSLHGNMLPRPEGDVLVHAGDCIGSGYPPKLDDFTRWMGSQQHKDKVLIAGNHEHCFVR